MAYDSARATTTQSIACTSASVAIGSAFASQTRQVRLAANTNCHYIIGDGAQTATTSHPYLPANFIEVVSVTPGQLMSTIRASTGGLVTATSGTLWVTELTE